MGLRADLRDDFPRGWWRSWRWWLDGLTEIRVFVLLALTTALRVRRLRAARRHQDDPVFLAREDAHLDAYVAGVLLGVSGLCLVGWAVVDGQLTWSLVTGVVLSASMCWCMGNVVVGSLMIKTIVESRRRQPQTWCDLDFIESHAPRNGRPPGTVEEYAALRMKSELR